LLAVDRREIFLPPPVIGQILIRRESEFHKKNGLRLIFHSRSSQTKIDIVI
jgi:hypothetical protein